MGAEEIKVHSRMTVVPSKPTPAKKIHPLSYLDHLMNQHILHSVYYFDCSAITERGKLIHGLKESLGKVLNTYPVFAGRLQKTDDGLWEVKCNDAGVRIYEATCSLSLQELSAKLLDNDLESQLSRTEINSDHTITPVAVIQFTDFSCGSLAIGMSWFQVLGDGMCGALFMKAWAETSRLAQVLHPPFHHSPSLRPRDQTNLNVKSRSYYAYLLKKSEENNVSTKQLKHITLSFSHDSVEKLITEVQNGAYKYGPAKPSDVLSAFLWVSIVRAQGKSAESEARASLCLEFRKIHLPPLPYGYVGNAVHFTGVSSPVGQLLNQDLSFAASLINENGGMVDTEEVRSVIDMIHELEQQGNDVRKNPPYLYSDGLSIAIFDHFMCYDVLFDIGKPLRVSYKVEPLKGDGAVIILPSAEGGSSRNVAVSLPADVMANLLTDAELSRYLPEIKSC